MMLELCIGAFLIIVLLLAQVLRRWAAAMLLVIPLPIFLQLRPFIGCRCIFSTMLLAMLDIRYKREESILIKYNPLVEGSKLPKGVILIFCLVAVIVSIIRLLMVFAGK